MREATALTSVEILYHFSCPWCNQWWSVGDFDWRNRPFNPLAVVCPHCGLSSALPFKPLTSKDLKFSKVE